MGSNPTVEANQGDVMETLMLIGASLAVILFVLFLISILKRGVEDIKWFWETGDYLWCLNILTVCFLVIVLTSMLLLFIYDKLIL